MPIFKRCLAVALWPALTAPAHGGEWAQFGYDARHSGNNVDERAVGRSNVAGLVALYPAPVVLPAAVDSAPVYRSDVVTPHGLKDLLFVLAKTGRLSALDAADGSEVWFRQIGGTLPTTSSPALDPIGDFVYSYAPDGYVHKFRAGDGTEITADGWPQPVTLKPEVERVASGLTIATTNAGARHLYAVTGGYNDDSGDYQGHLTAIDLDRGTQNVFNTLCSQLSMHFVAGGIAGVDNCDLQRSGIWGRGGATFDASTQRVYISTGNGEFRADAGGYYWSDSVLALPADGGSRGGLPLDSYTPVNYAELALDDADLGSGSLVILPAPPASAVRHLGLQIGKDALLRLIDLSDMGGDGVLFADGFEPAVPHASVGGELEAQPVWSDGSGFGMNAQPAVWVDGDGATWVFAAKRLGIAAFQLVVDGAGRPSLARRWTASGAAVTTSPIVANGLVYVAGDCAAGTTCITARDPRDGAVLWSSPPVGSVHWQSPILVDGRLYLTVNTKLWAFGLTSAVQRR